MILFFLAFFFVFSETTASANECLVQNPVDRSVYDFVDGKCIQVDCLQDSYKTPNNFQYCENGYAKTKSYDVNFYFPECKPIYSEQTTLTTDPVCGKCPSAQILTNYEPSQCIDGTKVYSRRVKAFHGDSCIERVFTENKFSNESCFSSTAIRVNGELVVAFIVVAIITIWFFWFWE